MILSFSCVIFVIILAYLFSDCSLARAHGLAGGGVTSGNGARLAHGVALKGLLDSHLL